MESDFIRKVGTDSKKVFYHQQHLSGGFFLAEFWFLQRVLQFSKVREGLQNFELKFTCDYAESCSSSPCPLSPQALQSREET